MHDAESSVLVLEALKDMGMRLAIDDFGTGYSSLSYLRRFPIDTLKIDRSFVRDIASDANDSTIVSAVIAMGRTLGQRVVAEGVETQEQLALQALSEKLSKDIKASKDLWKDNDFPQEDARCKRRCYTRHEVTDQFPWLFEPTLCLTLSPWEEGSKCQGLNGR